MRITVELFADLRRFLPPDAPVGPQEMEVEEGVALAILRRRLGIPDEEDIVAAVNGELAGMQQRLQEGDRVEFFSPMEGGGLGCGASGTGSCAST